MIKMIKGRYVAQVIIEFAIDEDLSQDMASFDEIKKRFTEDLAPAIKEIIEDETEDFFEVSVERQFADVWIVNDE